MKVLSDILHKAGILKEGAETYSSGGYSVLVRNSTTQRLETIASTAFANIYTANGTLTGDRILNTGGFDLIFTGTDTASAGTARFIQMTPTLVASANSDALIGLDVNPTFSVGSYTSVKRWGTRTRSLWINHDNWNAASVNPALYIGDASTAAFYVQPGIPSTGISATELFMRGNNPGLGLWYFTLQADYDVTFNAGPYVNNMYFNMGGSNAITIKNTRNVIVGGSTDEGFKFDVLGTSRFSGQITGRSTDGTALSLFAGTITFTASGGGRYINLSNAAINYTGGYSFAINGSAVAAAYFSGDGYTTYLGSAGGYGLQLSFNNNDTYTIRKGVNAGHIPLYLDIVGSDAFSGVNYGTRSGSVRIYSGAQTFGNGEGYVVLAHTGSATRGSVAIGASSTHASAILDITSTTKGFLQPRLTTVQRDAIASPATGLQVYNSTTNTNDYYNGTSWLSGGNVNGSGVAGQVAYWGGTNSVTGSSGLVYNDSTGIISLSKSQNNPTAINITNGTSNTNARVGISFISNTASGQFSLQKYSTLHVAYKINAASDAILYNDTAGDISILNDFATGKIKFAAGGSSTAQATLTAAGRLLLGTVSESTFLLDVNGNGRFSNTLSVISTATTNETAIFRSVEPYIIIEAAGGSNSASIFLKPSTASQNATIQNRTGGGLEFYVNADYTNPKMTIKGTTVNIRSLPTSATGLSSGDIWNDAGTLKVA